MGSVVHSSSSAISAADISRAAGAGPTVKSSSPPPWRIYLLGGCFVATAYFLATSPHLHHALYISLGLSSVVAVLIGVRRWRPRNAIAWYLLAGGQLGFVAADSIRAYYESVLGVEAPFPGLADVFFLVAYPLLAAGFVFVIRSRDPTRERASLIDATIIWVGLGVVFWVLLIEPYAGDAKFGSLDELFSTAYPLVDVLLIAVAARLAIGPGARTPAYYLLGSSLVLLLAADVVYVFAVLQETYHTGYVGDFGWLISYVLFGAAALHPSMTALTEPQEEQEVRLTRRRLALLAGASLTSPVMHAILALRGEQTEAYVTLCGSVVMFMLVLMRLAGLVSQLSGTLERTREAETGRKRTEERFTSLVQNSSDLVTVTDGSGVITYISPAVTGLLGHHQEELIGEELVKLIHHDDVAALRSVYREMVERSASQPTRLEYRWRHRDGSYRDAEVTFGNLLHDPSVRGIVLNTHDVTERKALEAQLAHQAFHDPLTDLANRELFRDRVEHALARRHGQPLAVLFLDIDDFKKVNDSLGHSAGDKLLLSVADRIRHCMREGDTAARLGGDEFGVLLEDTRDASTVAERITEAVREPISIDASDVCVTVSIGISVSTLGHDSAAELLRNADVAMYAAKNRGKGRFEQFEPDMHATAVKRLELEAGLRRAIDQNEFRVHYQPIVELASGRIAGVEALVRWAHPDRGMLAPGEFIALAEQTGLIVPLGRWVLEQACCQARTWRSEWTSEPPIYMSVNLSAEQLNAPELIDDVKKALIQSELPAEMLMLEITESVLMRDGEAAVARLEELREIGVKLAIDDFGTGFSSLSYLQRFPLDVLKVAKPFVDEMNVRAHGAALVRGIVELARTLDLGVIAEGVERGEQGDLLREMGCRFAQGYWFARPQSSQGIRELLLDSSRGTHRAGEEPLGQWALLGSPVLDSP
jgi:diguanylate cyclase (GGDEF)-like protein/PAS domain S-box-containing protein